MAKRSGHVQKRIVAIGVAIIFAALLLCSCVATEPNHGGASGTSPGALSNSTDDAIEFTGMEPVQISCEELCFSRNIGAEDVAKIKKLSQLKVLHFSMDYNYVNESDDPLSFIRELPALEELEIGASSVDMKKLVDLSVLQHTGITSLTLSGEKIDYTTLRSMELKKLVINTSIDLSSIAELNTVESLVVIGAENIERLTGLKIKHLSINRPYYKNEEQIENLDFILAFDELEEFDFVDGGVKDISALLQKDSLRTIRIRLKASEQKEFFGTIEIVNHENAGSLDECIIKSDVAILRQFVEKDEENVIVLFIDVNS